MARTSEEAIDTPSLYLRCFRPDRMTYAVTEFIAEKLHPKYTENRAVPFATSYEETGPGTACFFILSPGVDPLKDVEAIGKKIRLSNRMLKTCSRLLPKERLLIIRRAASRIP